MSCNIKIGEHTFKNIELVMFDISGTLYDYHELWLKEIGYISQLLAEKHSQIQGKLFRLRAMIIKVLGVDPETGYLDPNSCFFTLSTSEIKSILCSILYLNGISWVDAITSIDTLLGNMSVEIDIEEYTQINNGAKELIEAISKSAKVVTFSKRNYENPYILVKDNHLLNNINDNYNLYNNTNNTSEHLFLSNICKEKGIMPLNTLIIADSIYDLMIDDNLKTNRVIINKNNIDNYLLSKYSLKYSVSNLKDIEVI